MQQAWDVQEKQELRTIRDGSQQKTNGFPPAQGDCDV